MIVTLATLAAYRGIAEGISLRQTVFGLPGGLHAFGSGHACWACRSPVSCFSLALLATAVLLARTPLGLRLSAIGYNEVGGALFGA